MLHQPDRARPGPARPAYDAGMAAEPVHRTRVTLGILIAVACQAAVGWLWIANMYSFIYDAVPDSLFLLDLVVLAAEGLTFAAYAVGGGITVLLGRRGVGLGLMVGWLLGFIGLIVSTAVLFATVPADA